MASGLESFVNHTVSIITSDGRNFIGTLKGFDQTINIILDESHERVYSSTTGVEQVVLGLHIIRGDNVAIVGQIDEETDSRLNLSSIKAEPLNSVLTFKIFTLYSMTVRVVLLFMLVQCCHLHLHSENVGTVLFSDADNLRKCWPREKVSLLTSRMMFQDILPARSALNMADEQYNTALTKYFRMMVDTVKKKTSGKSKDIMLQALTDALGGYLYHLALPMAKHAFYMGNISYESVRKLYDLYDELAAFLRTNGKYWLPPITNFAGMNTGAKLEVLPMSDNEKSDVCAALTYIEHSDNSVSIPIPFLDSQSVPSSIAVPFKVYSLRNLQSKHTAYVLVKYYTTSIGCLKQKKATKSVLDKFNNDFEEFINAEVMVHLNDEQLYPAFGSVYRVLKTLNIATGHHSKYLESMDSGGPMKDFVEHKSKAVKQNKEETLEKGETVFEYLGDRNHRIILIPAIIFVACVWIFVICLYCFCKHRMRRRKPKKTDVDSSMKKADKPPEPMTTVVEATLKKSAESIKTVAPSSSHVRFSESSSSLQCMEKCIECEDRSKCVQIEQPTPSATSTPKHSARKSPLKKGLASKSTSKSAQSVPVQAGVSKTNTTSSTLSEKTDKPVVFGYDFETSSSDTDTSDTSGRTTPI
ncbi:uncharacterized protein CBL_02225 [Carabus blaptoides fortunei]